MCYSFDCIKRTAFTKEIEHIENNSKNSHLANGKLKYDIVEYLQKRIKEINEKYGEEPTRG